MKRIEQITLGITITVLAGLGSADDAALRFADFTKTKLSAIAGEAALEPQVNEDCDTNGEPPPCDMDCNANNRPDDLDIYMGTSRDCDVDRAPDECETPQPGDLDGDGRVGAADRSQFTACHRPHDVEIPPGCEMADLNGDGRVDCADWRIIRCAWTEGGPPEYARCRAASAVTPIDQ